MTGKLLHKYIYWLGCVVFIILLSGCQNTTEPPEPDTVAIFEGGKVTRQELKEAIDEPITLKDKSLEEEIKLKMKDVVGVHIRRGDVVDALDIDHPMFDQQPIIPDNHYREVMSKYKGKRFYISTDGSWDEVKFLYDEFDIINPYVEKKTAPTSGTMRVKHTFTKVEALDLFHLLHSEEFVMGLSTWSEWVQRQRRYRKCIVPPINFK